jgi:MerR family copper efflux transcriptional regulator
VSAKVIRYYEASGLIPQASRSDGGYRVYSEADIRHLRFIRRARDLGFSIERIQHLLGLWRDKSRSSADVKPLTLEHVGEIEAKIAALIAVHELASACECYHRPDCPILRDLDGGEPFENQKPGDSKRRHPAPEHMPQQSR